MSTSIHLILDVLQAALVVAHDAVLHGPDPWGDASDELIADVCALIGALDTLLQRYRDALTGMNDDLPF